MEKALRYNEGKAKWSLVHFGSFISMIKVLEFGSDKYTTIFIPKLEKTLIKWHVKVVVEIGKLNVKDCVILAMKHNCLIQIQSVKDVKKNISKITALRIGRDFLNSIGIEKSSVVPTQSIKSEKEMHTFLNCMASQQKSSTDVKNSLVSFVEKQNPLCKQIITMRQGNLEVCFAVSAITGLVSSTMILNCLEKLFNIYLPASDYLISGAGNWKKPMDRRKVLESSMRHMAALMDGEELYPESGLPHAGHLQCNVMFFNYHEKRGTWLPEKEKDIVTYDLPKKRKTVVPDDEFDD